MVESIYSGNASTDGTLDAGWLIGWFKDEHDVRHSSDVEIKWGEHPAGDTRTAWVRDDPRTAVMVLISGGPFLMDFPDRTVALCQRGDYVVWGRGVEHSWRAKAASVVLTVRWPSVAGFKAPALNEPSAGTPPYGP